ncbi:alpha/beta fold hydrolase [Micromonospora sp. M12]
MTTTESAPSRPLDTGGEPGPRVVIDHVQVSTFGLDANVEVRLLAGDDSASGYATGPAVDGYVLRLCAVAAAAAVDELLRGVESDNAERGDASSSMRRWCRSATARWRQWWRCSSVRAGSSSSPARLWSPVIPARRWSGRRWPRSTAGWKRCCPEWSEADWNDEKRHPLAGPPAPRRRCPATVAGPGGPPRRPGHVRAGHPATAAGAEPALYVHGLGGSSQNWTDLAGLLADRLDGQAIDLPGFGRSEPGRRYTIPAFADLVVRWIEHSGRGPVHLFGNSLGGAVAVRVAGSGRTWSVPSP